jgi:metallo-beta-lactamase class B
MPHLISTALLASLIVASAATLAAQDPPAVQARIDAARKLAGEQWAAAVDLFCATEQQVAAMKILPSANANDSPDALRREPMKVFDNLYFVGTRTDANWVLSTPEGYIVIDSGRPDRLEDTFLPGFKALGLDPARIRYLLIAHEHEDHYGGATGLQQRYPSLRVGMSAAAWDGVAKTADAPKRDLVLEEGKPVTLGGTSVTPIAIPGHTAGSLGFIFEVTDNGRRHVAGVFGGTVLNPTSRIPFDQYRKSIEHWQARTKAARVDVALQNHPIMDRTFERLATLKARRPDQPHPFVVGEASVQRLVGAMAECANAQLARRGAL